MDTTFIHYLGLAGRRATPRKRRPLPHLTSEYMRGLPTFTRRFFEALYSRLDSSSVVVFDNYQDIPPRSPVHELISRGLAVIPEGLTVVLISRHDPPPAMAHLQASGRVRFIGWADLQLTEAESFGIAELRGQIPVERGKEAIRRLHEETQGWAAGLILMLGQLGRVGNAQPFSAQSHQLFFDYFAGETLQKVDAETRDFLLKTALLPRIHVHTAEQLTGNPRAAQILDELSHHNFFTVKGTGSIPCYEYHALFREFLLTQMQAVFLIDDLAVIRRTAAGLLKHSGQLEEAAVLYQRTCDWPSLAALILKNVQPLSKQGRFSTLEQWLRALPQQQREGDPWLLFWLGTCRLPFEPPEARVCF